MTDAQKLEALVRRAVEGGTDIALVIPELKGIESTGAAAIAAYLLINNRVYQFLHSHEVARALFGEETICINCGQVHAHPDGICDIGYGFELESFEYHLQQAIILPTPSEQIDYFYRAVFND